ncbi:hypothetical protein IQ07DRAFT_646604 [Pyrenochaeta sp. DS3sAY3a]|nr:hypothetical protein IQ07DRAFT_646604 [Pyrenochaeta sp. DS3sAY3a]
MKKISSLVSIARLSPRPESPTSPGRLTLPRPRSTLSIPSIPDGTSIRTNRRSWTDFQAEQQQQKREYNTESSGTTAQPQAFDRIPTHDEAHAGPYGVETPPAWSYLVEGSEVKGAGKIEGLRENIGVADGVRDGDGGK